MIKLITTTTTKQSTNDFAEKLVETLKENEKTIAVAESCTGGLLAEQITEQEGASTVFEMGFVTYSNQVKTQLLHVSPDTLEQHSAFSKETAQEMAIGLARKSKADYNVAITGIAGPSNDESDKPVGTVYIAIATQRQVTCCEHYLFLTPPPITDIRTAIRLSAAEEAIKMVLSQIKMDANKQMKFLYKTQDGVIEGTIHKKLNTGDNFTTDIIVNGGDKAYHRLPARNYKVLKTDNNTAYITDITNDTTIDCGGTTDYDYENNENQLICPYCNHAENKLEHYGFDRELTNPWYHMEEWRRYQQQHHCKNCDHDFVINFWNEETVTTRVTTVKKYEDINIELKKGVN